MQIPPTYLINPKILQLISKIDSIRLFFKSFPIPIELKNKIERVSILKSSLYSARIEGNTLTMNELRNTAKISDRQKKLEVFNILDTLNYINTNLKTGNNINEDFILKIHAIVMNDLNSDSGYFRTEPGAIFNETGTAVYVTPPPEQIKILIGEMLKFANNQTDFPIISAIVSHLVFEKIHPFIDGNGRVGRLLIWAILKSKSYDFPIAIPLEEYIDRNRQLYYFHLDHGLSDCEKYIEFMLEGFAEAGEKIRIELLKESEKKEEIILPPRQEEILAIIRDHVDATFDFIKRRFIKVPERTLRYDLKRLADQKLIVKVGKTRGSFYRVKSPVV